LTLVCGLLTLAAANAEQWQSPDGVRSAARELTVRALGTASGAQVDVLGVDERLKLPKCETALSAEWQRPLRAGQGVVTVSCTSGAAWRLFVPVRAIEQVAVLVTTRNVQAGEVLAESDLAERTQATPGLPYEYLTARDQAVGLAVRRTLPAGTVLVPAALEHPELVERGALVTLVSGAGPVQVRSEGVALEPARLKQRIRVRSASGRVVEGVVQASGEVRVGS
jgi:flagella basal body P-ring formation protein FlgA